MADPQQGDVFLFQLDDGGEISVENGITEMRGSLETSVYLSLFGGNEDDSGDSDSTKGWWANLIETELAKKYISRTQHLLRTGHSVASRLRRIEDAVRLDLKWMVDVGVATSVDAEATVPALDTILIVAKINVQGEESEIPFILNWKRDIEANTLQPGDENAKTFSELSSVFSVAAFQAQPAIVTTLDPMEWTP